MNVASSASLNVDPKSSFKNSKCLSNVATAHRRNLRPFWNASSFPNVLNFHPWLWECVGLFHSLRNLCHILLLETINLGYTVRSAVLLSTWTLKCWESSFCIQRVTHFAPRRPKRNPCVALLEISYINQLESLCEVCS
jgi:hypothetical protein